MHSASKPWWQQATALVSLGAGGAVAGLSFVPGSAADLTSPSSMPIHLLALERSAQPAPADNATLRSAIINVANYYLRMAAGRTSAEMESLIWQHDSIDGVDHGASCAAFASLTLELGAHVAGRQSWVTGGTSYPWPLHKWADVRVNPNPASPSVTSIVQDAQAHHRWHPLGDGYEPQPGDWVLFNGHVEVVTEYSGAVLDTIGGDSLPNFSVNAHEYRDPLDAQGVIGFVDNGDLPGASGTVVPRGNHVAGSRQAKDKADPPATAIPGAPAIGSFEPTHTKAPGGAAIPGMPVPVPSHAGAGQPARRESQEGPDRTSPGSQHQDRVSSGAAADAGLAWADIPGPAAAQGPAAGAQAATAGTAVIPGLPIMAHHLSVSPATPYRRHRPSPPTAPVHDTRAEQAFIGEVAPGAVAAQRQYGVPASVTIAQAIDESGWGRSSLATEDHNLFGIKGTGPAGSDPQRTQEYENGQIVTQTKSFRVYHNAAESIDDHGKLLATSDYYTKSMADRRNPNAFAAALTGVYATDPHYGEKLISIMERYDLYRYDNVSPASTPHASAPAAAVAIPGLPDTAPASPASASPSAPAASATPGPGGHPAADQPTPAPSASAPSTPAPSTPAPSEPAPPTPAPSEPAPSTPVPSEPAPSTPVQSQPAPSQPAPSQPAPSEPAPSTPAPVTPVPSAAVPSTQAVSASRMPAPLKARTRRTAPRQASKPASRYQPNIPPAVGSAFLASARAPLTRDEPLYRDVASHSGIRWELLAACDWMQCGARARYSPVHGERLGTVNPDGTAYRTKSAALEQCADDLVELAQTVYRIDLTVPGNLSVRELASVFGAFRWGGLLQLHRTSAMEFPYSVAGLTAQHTKMHWPNIDEPNAPDRPGGRFRKPFGAVPIVLFLDYPATV